MLNDLGSAVWAFFHNLLWKIFNDLELRTAGGWNKPRESDGWKARQNLAFQLTRTVLVNNDDIIIYHWFLWFGCNKKNYLVKVLTMYVFIFFNTKFYSLGHTVLALFNLECLIPLRIMWGLHIKCVECLSKIKVFCICPFKVAFSFFLLEYH